VSCSTLFYWPLSPFATKHTSGRAAQRMCRLLSANAWPNHLPFPMFFCDENRLRKANHEAADRNQLLGDARPFVDPTTAPTNVPKRPKMGTADRKPCRTPIVSGARSVSGGQKPWSTKSRGHRETDAHYKDAIARRFFQSTSFAGAKFAGVILCAIGRRNHPCQQRQVRKSFLPGSGQGPIANIHSPRGSSRIGIVERYAFGRNSKRQTPAQPL